MLSYNTGIPVKDTFSMEMEVTFHTFRIQIIQYWMTGTIVTILIPLFTFFMEIIYKVLTIMK